MNIGTRSSPEDQVLHWMKESESLPAGGQKNAPADWGSYALAMALEAERLGDPLAEGERAFDVANRCASGTPIASPRNPVATRK